MSPRRAVATSLRLERIAHLARDLGRDLTRTSTSRTLPVHHAMANAIKTEIAAVTLALTRRKR